MGGDLNEVVDIRSGLAYLLVKWKIIVAAMIAGALIGALLSGRIGARTTGSYEDSLRNARAACSEEGAQYAEQLSAQYKAYNNELRRWGDYLNNAALLRIDPNNYVKKDIQYQLVSDSGDMAETFSGALLSAGDQQAIGEILGIDPLAACRNQWRRSGYRDRIGKRGGDGSDRGHICFGRTGQEDCDGFDRRE